MLALLSPQKKITFSSALKWLVCLLRWRRKFSDAVARAVRKFLHGSARSQNTALKVKQTSCAGGHHNMSRPLQVDLWPFDLESGVLVTCDVGYLYANFSLPRPLCSRRSPDVWDRQTDVRQTSVAHDRLMPPPYIHVTPYEISRYTGTERSDTVLHVHNYM